MTQEVFFTATHWFSIKPAWNTPGAFEAEFRPLNPKNGKPWQARHRINHKADVLPLMSNGRAMYSQPVYYSTIEAAREAVAWKQSNLKR